MKTILFPTDQSIKRERTSVTANTAPGTAVVLPVANSSGIVADDFIVVGPEGSEQAELCQVTAVTQQTITLATMKLVHYTDEPIVKYQYNQRKFYGSLTASGSYTELTVKGSMGGLETAIEIQKIAPSVKRIISSGYLDTAIREKVKDESIEIFDKPYTIEKLHHKLASLFGDK